MHCSLKAHLLKRPNCVEHTLSEQQAFFDDFRQEYNKIHSHEGLGHRLYRPSDRQYSNKVGTYEYEAHQHIRQVRQSGEIKWRGKTYYISQVLAKEPIAFEPLCRRHLADLLSNFCSWVNFTNESKKSCH
ncbi:hypothetical protein [Bibersteinia trehalosi]|uniref:hypothetical protein n=1 Tax=Bibersteinia trehalosi TaxID=47735 RepID=UPI002D797E8A|nr:hypothetical protein [Bibersteinia trehalosi]